MEAFCLLQNVNLHKIRGSHKSDHTLDICGRFCDGFASHTKAPLFPVLAPSHILPFWEVFGDIASYASPLWSFKLGKRTSPEFNGPNSSHFCRVPPHPSGFRITLRHQNSSVTSLCRTMPPELGNVSASLSKEVLIPTLVKNGMSTSG